MKKITVGLIFLAVLISIGAVIYFKKDRASDSPVLNNSEPATTTSSSQEETTGKQPSPEPQETQMPSPSPSPTPDEGKHEINGNVLYSEKIDLDGNGEDEKIEIIKAPVSGSTKGEYEGILSVAYSDGTLQKAVFVRRAEGPVGVFKSVRFEDIDGDGSKEVFIIIPDSGASFNLNYLFVYNHNLKRGLAFPGPDFGINLSDFVSGFTFDYKGNGALIVRNSEYGFEGTIDLKDNINYSETSEESNKAYERSWVDPTPLDLGNDFMLSLYKDEKGRFVIKAPLPVFGLATLDMIGEIDLLFTIDNNFEPHLKGFVLYDFDADRKVKAGECILIQ